MSKMNHVVNLQGEKILIETQQNEARKEVIELFKNYRKELGMTQTELGRRIGIPQSNVTRFESGNYNPTLEFLVKTAAAMGKRVKVSLED